MPDQLIRSQVMLDKEKRARLRKIAESQGKSLSELLRELVEQYLQAQAEKDTQELEQALSQLHDIRERDAQKYSVNAGDLINESRSERQKQKDEVKLLLDIQSLPPEARRQIDDYVTFLITKYTYPPKKQKKGRIVKLSGEKFIGIWQDREDMKESSEWVKNLRYRDWSF